MTSRACHQLDRRHTWREGNDSAGDWALGPNRVGARLVWPRHLGRSARKSVRHRPIPFLTVILHGPAALGTVPERRHITVSLKENVIKSRKRILTLSHVGVNMFTCNTRTTLESVEG